MTYADMNPDAAALDHSDPFVSRMRPGPHLEDKDN